MITEKRKRKRSCACRQPPRGDKKEKGKATNQRVQEASGKGEGGKKSLFFIPFEMDERSCSHTGLESYEGEERGTVNNLLPAGKRKVLIFLEQSGILEGREGDCADPLWLARPST